MNPNDNKNECLGEMRCDGCGGVAYVYRNKKQKLYSRCGNCGCDQRTGETMQAKFAAYVPVGTLEQQIASEPEAEVMPEVSEPEAEIMLEVSEPEAETMPEVSEPEAAQMQTKSGKRGLFVLLGAAALGVVGVML